MSRQTEGYVRSLAMRDGAQLAYRHWPVTNARGAVIVLHGIQSHSGWYGASASFMAEAGYEVIHPDRRGSGLNKTARGDLTDYRVAADDLREFVADTRRRLPTAPVHLQAISWGAKLACATLIEHDGLVDSLSLIGAGLTPKVDVSLGVKLRTAAALLTNPVKRFDIPLSDPRLFTDTPERVAFIREDLLSLRQCTARFLYQTHRLDRFIRRGAKALRTPLLVLMAGRDRIVDNDALRWLIERFSSRPKEIVVFEDACHTLEFEPDPTEVFESMVRWLDARTEAAGEG
jgi:alpha-beta hydrolase superfamily lysophospholipase